MRSTTTTILDRIVPAFVLPYTIWTIYVNLSTATHASFDDLLVWLPLVVLIAFAATVAWLRSESRGLRFAMTQRDASVSSAAVSIKVAGGVSTKALVVLVLAVLWVGLLSAGLSYVAFWWAALIALGGVWVGNLREASCHSPAPEATRRHAIWIVLAVAAAAICVTLFANRPDADDAFYLSIPATLLRFPQQQVLLHDTLYRLPQLPIQLPVYRLSGYEVLIGILARITGIDLHVIAYLILPPVFAVLSVLAWAYLLRRLVPARWPTVLLVLFVCVLGLGEVHQAYGNFAFVRLFQGKAILATCMAPVIVGAALSFSRKGGLRNWILLFAAQVAALGVTSTALFVAPTAAALGLAGGWLPSAWNSRRFVGGLLASSYVLAAAAAMALVTHGGQGFASARPMPGMLDILASAWGPWSTRVLLVALLAAWAFIRDPVYARYLVAGAFFFLLAVLNPYTPRFVADHFVGASTYWRLTWALPLPFFLAVILDDVVRRAIGIRPVALAVAVCLPIAGIAGVFFWHAGTLRSANAVTLGLPGLKVEYSEYHVARRVADSVPESGVVLAPEAVSTWLPTFVHHPELLGVRVLYLHVAFGTEEAARRQALMEYVAGSAKPPDSVALFTAALRRYRLTAVVFRRSVPWRHEIEGVLKTRDWRVLESGAYEIWMKPATASTTVHG